MSVQSDDSLKDTSQTPEQPPNNGAQIPDDLETLRSELAEIEQKADEYLRLAQRTQADFINYRRRMDEERAQQARDAGVAFLQRLFPILDDFERAKASGSPAELASSWGQGIQLVERNLRALLSAEGVEPIDIAPGAEFDPRQQEALGSTQTTDIPEGHIVAVTRPGYKKGDRVLRPAQVIVAKRPN